MNYPNDPPGLLWDGYMFNEQIDAARKRAETMAAPQSVQPAVRELTAEQRRAYVAGRQWRYRKDEQG